MNVLVTGGCGFIGSHSVEALLREGARVRVLDDFSNGDPGNLPEHANLEIIEGDVRDRATVVHATWGVSHVLHLAAQVSVQGSIANPSFSCSVNVNGFLNVLDAAVLEGVKRVVYASSAAVYGNVTPAPIFESQVCMPSSPYGLEKLINDQYAALYRRLHGLSCLGLRYFNAYGPRQRADSPYSGVISRFAQAAFMGEDLQVFGDGTQSRDFVYVGDIARVNRLALENSAEGICNVATGRSITLNELIQVLGTQVGKPIVVTRSAAREGDIKHSAAQVEHLQRTLGYVPDTPLGEGLRHLLAEYPEEPPAGLAGALH